MNARFRHLALLAVALAACGEPAPAELAALRNAACAQGLPELIHGRLVDAAGPPLAGITRVSVTLYGKDGASAPFAEAVHEGGGPLPERYALCADPAQVEADPMPIAIALVEMEDRRRQGTSGSIELGDAQLPLQVDLFLINRQLSLQGVR